MKASLSFLMAVLLAFFPLVSGAVSSGEVVGHNGRLYVKGMEVKIFIDGTPVLKPAIFSK